MQPSDPETTSRTSRAWNAAFLLGGIITVAKLVGNGNIGAVATATLLAAVPLTVLLLVVATLARLRERPFTGRRFSLMWGALIATTISYYLNPLTGDYRDHAAIVVWAPIIEETAKTLGLLVLVHQRRIGNTVDGILHAFLIGAGFAAVENIHYFLNAVSVDVNGTDPGAATGVFLARGVLSPFVHPIFTILAGAVIGRRATKPLDLIGGAGVGLTASVLAHGFWNQLALNGILGVAPWSANIAAFTAVYLTVTTIRRENLANRRNDTLHAAYDTLDDPVNDLVDDHGTGGSVERGTGDGPTGQTSWPEDDNTP